MLLWGKKGHSRNVPIKETVRPLKTCTLRQREAEDRKPMEETEVELSEACQEKLRGKMCGHKRTESSLH